MATTTNYGWETPDDTDLVKDGALAMRTTANSIDSTLGTALNNKLHAGLVLIKTQTIGTGVSSVTVTNAFNSTYDAYKIIISGGAGSNTNYGQFQLTGATSAYYFAASAYPYAGGSPSNLAANNLGAWLYSWYLNTNYLDLNIELTNPFLSKQTKMRTVFSSEAFGFAGGGEQRSAASYTGFTIQSIGTETLTGGTIAVYGYAKD